MIGGFLSNVRIVSRASWGARVARDFDLLNPGEVRGLAFHYSGSNADEQDRHSNCAARVRGIQNYHMDVVDPPNHWLDIAYNLVVCRHGYIFIGRGYRRRSAANGTNDGNSQYVAVCFLGNDTEGRDDVTWLGRRAMRRIIRRFPVWYGHTPLLRPHSFFRSTECPGDEIRAFIARES